MKLLIAIALLMLLASAPACKKSGTTLPPAASGNTPAGSDPSDEPSIESGSYIQSDTRTPVEYSGASD